MNPLDFTYLLPRHLNISSSFCPSMQLWSQWQDKSLLHTLHPHYQGSHSSVLWVMSTHRCLVRCGTMFGGQYHECRLRTGTSANICSLSALSHMWEGCSSDCKEVSWKKKKIDCLPLKMWDWQDQQQHKKALKERWLQTTSIFVGHRTGEQFS